MPDITDRISEVLRDHGFRAGGNLGDGTVVPHSCWGAGCQWEGQYSEHRAHVAAVLVELLGMTQEFAACIDDDGEVLLVGNGRYLRQGRYLAAAEASERRDAFVGTAWVTRWERSDG